MDKDGHVGGFYCPERAFALREKLDQFKGGKFVVDVAALPVKCSVAPLEFALLADELFARRGIRADKEITIVTPLSGAFTKPVCNDLLSDMLEERNISVVPNFELMEVDSAGRRLVCPDNTEVPYDLAVIIPPHDGSPLVDEAGLGNELGYGRCDKHTLQSLVDPDIYFLGDIADVPTSKAGSVAHFQAEVLVEQCMARLTGREAVLQNDGHARTAMRVVAQESCVVFAAAPAAPAQGAPPTNQPCPGRSTLYVGQVSAGGEATRACS